MIKDIQKPARIYDYVAEWVVVQNPSNLDNPINFVGEIGEVKVWIYFSHEHNQSITHFFHLVYRSQNNMKGCIQVYSVVNRTSREVWKTKPRRTEASVEHSPRRPLFAQDDDEVFVTGSTLYAVDEGRSNLPLVITPVFCCRRTS